MVSFQFLERWTKEFWSNSVFIINLILCLVKNINLSQIETESGPDSAVGNSNKNPLISSLHKEKEDTKDKGEGKDKSHLKGKVEGKHSDLLKEQPLLTRNSSLK